MSGAGPPGRGGRKYIWNDFDGGDFPSLSGQNLSANGKYLVLECSTEGKEMQDVNPFLVGKFLQRIFPNGVYGTRKFGKGHLLVHAKSGKDAEKAIGETDIDVNLNLKVKISAHKGLNTSRGKVFYRGFKDVDEQTIVSELKSYKVTEARKIKKKVNGELTNTECVVLTFDVPNKPSEIRVAEMILTVFQYYDNPMRCLKCQKYGHTIKRCASEKAICADCSLTLPHENCGAKKCVPCGLGHASYDRSCKIRQEEQAICKMMTDRKISYWAAKNEWTRKTDEAAKNLNFAQAARNADGANSSPPVTQAQFAKVMEKLEEQDKHLKENATLIQEMKSTIDAQNKLIQNLMHQISQKDELLAQHNIAVPMQMPPPVTATPARTENSAKNRNIEQNMKEIPLQLTGDGSHTNQRNSRARNNGGNRKSPPKTRSKTRSQTRSRSQSRTRTILLGNDEQLSIAPGNGLLGLGDNIRLPSNFNDADS